MHETLRPSTLGEILDRTANLYRGQFLVFFGLAAIPASIMLGLSGGAVLLFAWAGLTNPTATGTPTSEALGGLVIGMIALGLVALPLTIASNALCGASLCHAASVRALGGTTTINQALKAVYKLGWRYIGLYLLQALIIVGIPFGLWTVLIMMVSLGAAAVGVGDAGGAGVLLSGALFLLLMAGLAVYVVWMLLQLCLAFPIAVVEGAPIGVSLRRAWYLCRGTRSRMLVMLILGLALGWVASLLVSVPMVVLVSLVPGLSSPQHAAVMGTMMMIGLYGMSFAVQALIMPVFAIALVLFYYDQRVRREGFDVELLMQQAGMLAEPALQAEAAPGLPQAGQAAEANIAPVVETAESGVETPAQVVEPAGGQVAEQIHTPSDGPGGMA